MSSPAPTATETNVALIRKAATALLDDGHAHLAEDLGWLADRLERPSPQSAPTGEATPDHDAAMRIADSDWMQECPRCQSKNVRLITKGNTTVCTACLDLSASDFRRTAAPDSPLMTAAPLTEVLDFRELLINLRCFTHTYGIDHDIVLKAEDECDAAYRRAISEVERLEQDVVNLRRAVREVHDEREAARAEVERVTKERDEFKNRIRTLTDAICAGKNPDDCWKRLVEAAGAVRGDAAIRDKKLCANCGHTHVGLQYGAMSRIDRCQSPSGCDCKKFVAAIREDAPQPTKCAECGQGLGQRDEFAGWRNPNGTTSWIHKWCVESWREKQKVAAVQPPREEAPRTCNRHKDCDAADRKAREAGRTYADHCHDDCCEDCFGN